MCYKVIIHNVLYLTHTHTNWTLPWVFSTATATDSKLWHEVLEWPGVLIFHAVLSACSTIFNPLGETEDFFILQDCSRWVCKSHEMRENPVRNSIQAATEWHQSTLVIQSWCLIVVLTYSRSNSGISLQWPLSRILVQTAWMKCENTLISNITSLQQQIQRYVGCCSWFGNTVNFAQLKQL